MITISVLRLDSYVLDLNFKRMKKLIYILAVIGLFYACDNDKEDDLTPSGKDKQYPLDEYLSDNAIVQ